MNLALVLKLKSICLGLETKKFFDIFVLLFFIQEAATSEQAEPTPMDQESEEPLATDTEAPLDQESEEPLADLTEEPLVPQPDELPTADTESLATTAADEPLAPQTEEPLEAESEELPVTETDDGALEAVSEVPSVTDEQLPTLNTEEPSHTDASEIESEAPQHTGFESAALPTAESGAPDMELPYVEPDLSELVQDDEASFGDAQMLPTDLEQALSEVIGEAVANEPSIVHQQGTSETSLDDAAAAFSMDTNN